MILHLFLLTMHLKMRFYRSYPFLQQRDSCKESSTEIDYTNEGHADKTILNISHPFSSKEKAIIHISPVYSFAHQKNSVNTDGVEDQSTDYYSEHQCLKGDPSNYCILSNY